MLSRRNWMKEEDLVVGGSSTAVYERLNQVTDQSM
jgi:hypothetical protein